MFQGGLYTGRGSGVGMNIISPPANHRRVSGTPRQHLEPYHVG